MKTAELTGDQLDEMVARAQGWIDYPADSIEHGDTWHMDPEKAPFGRIMPKSNWAPSTDWAQGGPIIEREHIQFEYHGWHKTQPWCAQKSREVYHDERGPTALVAAMRAFVASKFGEDVL